MLCIVVCFCLSPGTYLEYFVLHHTILSLYILYILYMYTYIYYILLYMYLLTRKKRHRWEWFRCHMVCELWADSAQNLYPPPKGQRSLRKPARCNVNWLYVFGAWWHGIIEFRSDASSLSYLVLLSGDCVEVWCYQKPPSCFMAFCPMVYTMFIDS